MKGMKFSKASMSKVSKSYWKQGDNDDEVEDRRQ